MTLRFRPEAEDEYLHAVSWYEEQREGLGHEFIQAVESTLDFIEENPEMYPVIRGELRRALLRRFPFALLYRVREQDIIVAGVVHLRRNPTNWSRREG
ncbi:MAG: type II toxin-antitoxin system RelE/ParE family toxin [Myxococcota bacterium]|nr:type II toxin-antitoxin system RelE/ParE family toxin [Myxococcota bacterium]